MSDFEEESRVQLMSTDHIQGLTKIGLYNEDFASMTISELRAKAFAYGSDAQMQMVETVLDSTKVDRSVLTDAQLVVSATVGAFVLHSLIEMLLLQREMMLERLASEPESFNARVCRILDPDGVLKNSKQLTN